jgi:hypothetical protein
MFIRKTDKEMSGSIIILMPRKEATQYIFFKAAILYLKGDAWISSDSVIKGTDTGFPYIWSLSPKDLLIYSKRAAMSLLGDDYKSSEINQAFKKIVEINQSFFGCTTVKEVYTKHGYQGIKKVMITALKEHLISSIGEDHVELTNSEAASQ